MPDSKEKPYDSAPDTKEHIRQVYARLRNVIDELHRRGQAHDLSKLHDPIEKEGFDAATAKLKTLTYGSAEYNENLKALQPVLTHHYANNSHHPEHYVNGVAGMDLLDVIEMYCDWAAAVLRSKDGSLEKSIEINVKKHHIEGPLASILMNTFLRHGGFTGYNAHKQIARDVIITDPAQTRIRDGLAPENFYVRTPKGNRPL